MGTFKGQYLRHINLFSSSRLCVLSTCIWSTIPLNAKIKQFIPSLAFKQISQNFFEFVKSLAFYRKLLCLQLTVFSSQTGSKTCDIRSFDNLQHTSLLWENLKSPVLEPVWYGKTLDSRNLILHFCPDSSFLLKSSFQAPIFFRGNQFCSADK